MSFRYLDDPAAHIVEGNVDFWIEDRGEKRNVLLLLEALNYVRQIDNEEDVTDLSGTRIDDILREFHAHREGSVRAALQRLLDRSEGKARLAAAPGLTLTSNDFTDDDLTQDEVDRW